jgi:hypothetical protein
MEAIRFTVKVWITSLVSGFIILLAFYISTSHPDIIDKIIFRTILLVSLISSLPILVLLMLSVYLISRTDISTVAKKMIIALIITILTIATVLININPHNGGIQTLLVNPGLLIFALPYWLPAMLAIFYFKLELNNSPKA